MTLQVQCMVSHAAGNENMHNLASHMHNRISKIACTVRLNIQWDYFLVYL